MDTEKNKAVAREFFARFTANDVDGALALLTDDAVWRVPGQPDRMPFAGQYSKAKVARLFHGMVEQLTAGLAMTVIGCTAEGDRVAVEAESRGDFADGRAYRQQYHLLMEFRDGRICRVREYLDTQHAHDVWVAPRISGA
jgi:ketosteroid isomerase-like protein